MNKKVVCGLVFLVIFVLLYAVCTFGQVSTIKKYDKADQAKFSDPSYVFFTNTKLVLFLGLYYPIAVFVRFIGINILRMPISLWNFEPYTGIVYEEYGSAFLTAIIWFLIGYLICWVLGKVRRK